MLFTVNRVTDPKEMTEIYQLRYKVYCEEWGFEKPEDHPGKIEKDVYDDHSLHLAAKDKSGTIIGTVRLVLHSKEGYPIEKHMDLDINTEELPRKSLSEISRFAISNEYRRRAEDAYYYGRGEDTEIDDTDEDTPGPGASDADFADTGKDKRRKHEIIYALYSAIWSESKQIGLTHWYAIMARNFHVLIKRYGIRCFQPIGDTVNYHGLRTPHLAEIKKFESENLEKNDALRQEFKDHLGPAWDQLYPP